MTRRKFLAVDRKARLQQVRDGLAAVDCEALVVTKPENIRWLTGFTGSNGIVGISCTDFVLVTDGRYTTQAASELSESAVEAETIISRDPVEALLAGMGSPQRLGLEAQDVSWAQQRQFARSFIGTELVSTEGLVEEYRKVKDEGEIERLKYAAEVTDQALAAVRSELAENRTERQVARMLENAMAELGADEASFSTIVASGPNSALPHAAPTDRTISSGDLVIIDVGARVDGYGSDMTRTFMIGPVSSEQTELYDAVARAQLVGLSAVRNGVKANKVDALCRRSLADDDLEEAFIHGTGHGIGLEIHENPILSARTEEVIQSGYVITVEPGAYLPNVGGVRIEDSVVVTESGCELITKSPKVPQVI